MITNKEILERMIPPQISDDFDIYNSWNIDDAIPVIRKIVLEEVLKEVQFFDKIFGNIEELHQNYTKKRIWSLQKELEGGQDG